MSSYWPISNLTTISKVIERLVLDRLRPHLLSSPNFSRLQSAYRRRHSTETALLHVMNTVYTASDAKITALVGLDISAAFNTINHDVLAIRLESQFGVVGAASSWLWSYLHCRQKFVRLGRHLSPMTQCDCGVPKGSVLGPAAVHCLRVSCWRADLSRTACHTISSPMTCGSSSAWTAPMPHRPSTGLLTTAAVRLWLLLLSLLNEADKVA